VELRGPEYISFSEFEQRQAKKSRVRFRALLSTLLGVLAVASAVAFAPAFMAARRVHALSAELDDVRLYTVHIIGVNPDNTEAPLRDESYTAGSSRLSMWGGGVVITTANGVVHTVDPVANTEIVQLDFDGTARFMDRVRRALDSTPIHLLGDQEFEELVPESDSVKGYRFTSGDERYTLYMDEGLKRPVRCNIDEKELSGWARREIATFDPKGAQTLSETPLSSPSLVDLTSPHWAVEAAKHYVASYKMAQGESYVLNADANNDGCVFLFISGTRVPMTIIATDDKGNKCYAAYELPVGIMRYGEAPGPLWPELYCIRNTDESTIHWPLSLHMDLRAPFGNATSVGSLDYSFNKPTCSVLPYYALPQYASDLPYLDLKTQVEFRRGQYLGHLYRDAAGNPVDPEANDAANTAVRLSDRSHAIEEFSSALHYLRIEGPVNSKVTLADIWMSCYTILKELGQDLRAREALLNASSSYKQHPASEHTAAEIQGAMDDEGLTNR
jgi:hypothetical protein